MIEVLEKIGAGICGLFIVATVVGYTLMGLPSPKATAWLPSVYEDPSPRLETPPAPGPDGKPSTAVSPKMQALVDKLAEQGRKVSVRSLQMKHKKVPTELFEFLNARANLTRELKTAKARFLKGTKGNTRLQIYDIRRNSVLEKMGFRDNDVFELFNGQIVNLDNHSVTKYDEMWNEAKAQLRAGKPVSATITRNNRPIHIEFRL